MPPRKPLLSTLQQASEFGVSQFSAASALDEFHFAGLFRFRPNTFAHHFGRERVLMFAGLLRQIHERASLCFKVLHGIVNFPAIEFV